MRRVWLTGLLVVVASLNGCTAATPNLEASKPTATRGLGVSEPTEVTPLVDPVDLLSAPIPSVCNHPAGTLVDGTLPGIPENQGVAELHYDVHEAVATGKSTPVLAFGALSGAAVAAPIVCSRGGVSWPNVIVLWDANLNIVGSVNLGEVTTGGFAYDLTIDGMSVTASWIAKGPGDAGCCGTVTAIGLFTPGPDHALVKNELRTERGEGQVRQLLEAVVKGDEVGEDLADPVAVAALARVYELGRTIDVDSITCPGGELDGGEYGGDERPVLGAPTCWATMDDGEVFGFGLTYGSGNTYRIETAYAG